MIDNVDVENSYDVPQRLRAGSYISFSSDYSVTEGGFRLCFSAASQTTMSGSTPSPSCCSDNTAYCQACWYGISVEDYCRDYNWHGATGCTSETSAEPST